jgi:hypothetical protein
MQTDSQMKQLGEETYPLGMEIPLSYLWDRLSSWISHLLNSWHSLLKVKYSSRTLRISNLRLLTSSFEEEDSKSELNPNPDRINCKSPSTEKYQTSNYQSLVIR